MPTWPSGNSTPSVNAWPSANRWPASNNWPAGVVPLDPAALPGLTLWFDGRKPAFSDAGVTPATVPFGRVAQIAQPAPLTGNWTSSGTNRPWRDTDALDFHTAETNRVTAPAYGAVTPSNNCTIGIAFQSRGPYPQQNIFGSLDGSGGFTTITVSGNSIYYGSANVLAPALATLAGADNVQLVLRFRAGSVDYKGTVNGVAFSGTVASAPFAGTLGVTLLGDNGVGSPTQASVSQLVVSNQIISDANRDGLLAFMQTNAASNPPTSAPLMNWMGDSIGAGLGLVSGPQITAYQVEQGLIGNPTPPRLVNPSQSGATIVGAAANYPTLIAPFYSASRARNILIWQVATNSLSCAAGNEAATKAAAIAALYAACDISKAAGWLNILCTCLPSTNATRGTGFEAARLLYNADVLANFAAHGAASCDFGGTAGMSTPADAAGANFQADNLHVSAAGYVIMTGVLQPVIASIL